MSERTISKAKKPTMSTVSSLAFSSNAGGRLRNSRKRFARKKGSAKKIYVQFRGMVYFSGM